MKTLCCGCSGYLLVCCNVGPGSRAIPCGIYGEQSVSVTVFSVITSVLLFVSSHR